MEGEFCFLFGWDLLVFICLFAGVSSRWLLSPSLSPNSCLKGSASPGTWLQPAGHLSRLWGAAGGSTGLGAQSVGCLWGTEPRTCSPVFCQVQVWGCAIFPCCCGRFWDLLPLPSQPSRDPGWSGVSEGSRMQKAGAQGTGMAVGAQGGRRGMSLVPQ